MGGEGRDGRGEEEPQVPVIESVGFCPSLPLALTGSLSGVLAVWDLPTQKLRQQCRHEVLVQFMFACMCVCVFVRWTKV